MKNYFIVLKSIDNIEKEILEKFICSNFLQCIPESEFCKECSSHLAFELLCRIRHNSPEKFKIPDIDGKDTIFIFSLFIKDHKRAEKFLNFISL